MRPWNRSTDEDGSASLEFLTVGVILLVPLAYLVIALAQIQQAALGVEAAARYTARAIAQHHDAGPDAVIAAVAEAYDLDAASLDARVTCSPVPTPCPAAGSAVTVTISHAVALPLIPPILGLDELAQVPVDATSVYRAGRMAEGAL